MKVRQWTLIVTLCAVLAIATSALADGLIRWVELTKTNSDTAVPVRLKATPTVFKRATIYGRKAARTDNTGTVYIGTNSTNDTQTVAILPGASIVIEAPERHWFDLYDLYLDVATANDGVVVLYEW